jgi:type I restriction enzyme S subunit
LVESELGEIPRGWEVKTFGEVAQCYDSKRIPLSKKQREQKKPGDIPYYGATSIMDYVNEWIFNDIYLLIGEDGSVIKEKGTPFVQYIWGKSWVNNHAHILQGKNGVSTEHLMIFIQSQNISAYITGAVQLKLNQGNMNSIPFLHAGKKQNAAFYGGRIQLRSAIPVIMQPPVHYY